MKRIIKLFLKEIKHIYIHSLIFILISTIMFTLSISLFCFSLDIVKDYKNYLDESFEYLSITLRVNDLEQYDSFVNIGDYLEVDYGGLTYYPTMKFGDKENSNTMGTSFIFDDELHANFRKCKFIGAQWSKKDNFKEDSYYNIFLSSELAENLNIAIGGKLIFKYWADNELRENQFNVKGIYSKEDGVVNDFIIPFAFIYDVYSKLNDKDSAKVSFYVGMDRPSDILNVLPKLQRLGIDFYAAYPSVDEVNLMNLTRTILYVLSSIVFILALLILNNILSITVKKRQQYMARLKLLGASTGTVANLYYVLLVVSFLIAFVLSIILSILSCNYFTYIANIILDFKTTISIHWSAVGILLVFGIILIAIRYLFFYKKVKNITPLAFIKAE